MAHGYTIAGTAAHSPDFIPSLIGIAPGQLGTNPRDMYFERSNFALAALVGKVNSVARTQWVTYDSLPLDHQDMILAVKAGSLNFYAPASELLSLAEEIVQSHNDTTLLEMVRLVVRTR